MDQKSVTAALSDGPKTFGLASRLNHWVIAVTMIGMLISGLVMAHGPFELEIVGAIRDWHKPIGVLVLDYGLWRIGWRVGQGFPKAASVMPRWQAVTSRLTHWALLATVLVMPISGIAMSFYNGRAVSAFGLIIPAQDKIERIANAAGSAHHFAAFALIGLLALHVGAALKHHLIDRDSTLRRMVG